MGVLGNSYVTTKGDLLKDKDIVLLALWKSVRSPNLSADRHVCGPGFPVHFRSMIFDEVPELSVAFPKSLSCQGH